MQEMSFLQEPGFTVTSSRVDIAGRTFATRNIGSVNVVAPHRSEVGTLVGVVGLLALLAGADVLGLWLVIGGGLWAFINLNVRKLRVEADGGAILTLESCDAAMIERVRAAIARAMSAA